MPRAFFLPLLDLSVMIVSASVLLTPVQVGQTWVFTMWNYLFISFLHVLLFSVALVCEAFPAHHSSKLSHLAVRTQSCTYQQCGIRVSLPSPRYPLLPTFK